jgi:hypothetical protein
MGIPLHNDPEISLDLLLIAFIALVVIDDCKLPTQVVLA